MKHFFYIISDIRCILCGKLLRTNSLLCPACRRAFYQKRERICSVCGHPLFVNGSCPSCKSLGQIYYDSYKYLQLYYGYCRRIIVLQKKEGFPGLVSLYMELLLEHHCLDPVYPVTVVPDHFLHKIHKGRSGLSCIVPRLRKNGFTVYTSIVRRKLFAGKQKNRDAAARLTDVNKSYYLNPEYPKVDGGEITLLDDVYTTGATVNRCAALLKEAGYKKVHVVTLFRAFFRDNNDSDG